MKNLACLCISAYSTHPPAPSLLRKEGEEEFYLFFSPSLRLGAERVDERSDVGVSQTGDMLFILT
ncbi:MAG: hypothetical protein JWQ66_4333 [Mucilaginibacter sp.]|nr:hypothetical protein [Mucilaginibacter sp.]